MIDAKSLINDGLTTNCANNGETTWTCNQGVILDGLTDLYKVTRMCMMLQTRSYGTWGICQNIISFSLLLTISSVIRFRVNPPCAAASF